MRTLPFAVVAGLLAAACAALSSDIDDGGRAARQIEEAPVDAAVQDDTLRTAQIELARQEFDLTRTDPQAAEEEDETPVAARCDASRWQGLLGQDVAGLDRRLLPNPYRVIPEGAMVTQDFVANRLNLELDAESIIVNIRCG